MAYDPGTKVETGGIRRTETTDFELHELLNTLIREVTSIRIMLEEISGYEEEQDDADQ